VRQPVSSLEPDVQIVAKPHPDPAQRSAWRRLWALLLSEEIPNQEERLLRPDPQEASRVASDIPIRKEAPGENLGG
jgi:hypothetical protein